MRNILFRGKRTDNGEWVEGGGILHTYEHDGAPKEEVYIIKSDSEFECRADEFGNIFEIRDAMFYAVDPDAVCEWTGMTDKNGKRIFEGDVVRFKMTDALGWTRERVGQVLYYNDPPCFYVLSTTGDAWDWFVCENMEVIGNIYDNAELLVE